jgi:NADH dehydrogenase [ubiquinone] 1 alpha subcomplex assembly factor 7
MNALARRIADRIRAFGPISLADYMGEASNHPTLGYYRQGDPLGSEGDFTTAPEISQMFGELAGLWLAECWQRLGRPRPVQVVELGPGRGTLMADALRAWRVVPEFRLALDLHLVESSPGLTARQAAALVPARPTWHGDFAAVPEGPMVLVANEFFDALPIRQFQRTEAGWCERLVGLAPDGADLAFVLAPPNPSATALLAPALGTAPIGAVAEVSPAARGLGQAIGARLKAAPGAALIVDYGYAPSAPGDTLQAVRRHQRADPLCDPGMVDLSAHVDFAALAGSASAAGAQVWGPLAQGLFLTRLGIGRRAARLLEAADPDQGERIRTALRRLIDKEEMGTLFRVLALTSPGFGAPPGFEPPTAAES